MDTDGYSGKQRDRPGEAGGFRDGRSAKPNDVPGWLNRWGADLLLTLGALLISAGAWCIYPPAGLIVGGALLIAGGVLCARGGGGEP